MQISFALNQQLNVRQHVESNCNRPLIRLMTVICPIPVSIISEKNSVMASKRGASPWAVAMCLPILSLVSDYVTETIIYTENNIYIYITERTKCETTWIAIGDALSCETILTVVGSSPKKKGLSASVSESTLRSVQPNWDTSSGLCTPIP